MKAAVAEVRRPKRFGGRALVSVETRSLELCDERVALEGEINGPGRRQAGKDTAIIAGSAASRALLGKALGEDAVVGAVVGGGIGTVVAWRRGPAAVLPAGTVLQARTVDREPLRPASDV